MEPVAKLRPPRTVIDRSRLRWPLADKRRRSRLIWYFGSVVFAKTATGSVPPKGAPHLDEIAAPATPVWHHTPACAPRHVWPTAALPRSGRAPGSSPAARRAPQTPRVVPRSSARHRRRPSPERQGLGWHNDYGAGLTSTRSPAGSKASGSPRQVVHQFRETCSPAKGTYSSAQPRRGSGIPRDAKGAAPSRMPYDPSKARRPTMFTTDLALQEIPTHTLTDDHGKSAGLFTLDTCARRKRST